MADASELIDSQQTSGTPGESDYRVVKRYVVTGTDSATSAYTELLTEAGASITAPDDTTTLVRDSISMDPVFIDEDGSEGIWQCDVDYVTQELKDEKEQVSVRTLEDGQTVPPDQEPDVTARYQVNAVQGRRLYSRERVITETDGTYTDDTNGAIEVDEQGINGADIEFGATTFTLTKTYSKADFNSSKVAWAENAFKVNSGTYEGYAAGEVLYRGYDALPNNSYDRATNTLTEEFDVTFSFAVSPNGAPDIASASLPDGVTASDSINKKGWYYFWILRQRQDIDADPLAVTPIAAYVDRVYPEVDFSTISLPTT